MNTHFANEDTQCTFFQMFNISATGGHAHESHTGQHRTPVQMAEIKQGKHKKLVSVWGNWAAPTLLVGKCAGTAFRE